MKGAWKLPAHSGKVSRAKTHKLKHRRLLAALQPINAEGIDSASGSHFAFLVHANLLAETPTAAALQGTSPGSDEELVKQLSNPVSSLVSVPFQNNFDFGLGTGEGCATR